MDLLKFLPNKTCVDKLKQCNEITPFSETILKFGENPATGRKYTEDERNDKLKQLDNLCSYETLEVQKCCDSKNKLYNGIDYRKLNKRGKRIIKNGEVIGYELCNPKHQEDCDENYKVLNPKDLCRLSNNVDKLKDESLPGATKIYDLIPDCYSSLCSNSRSVPFIYDPMTVETDHSEELKMLKSVRDDNLDDLTNYFNNVGIEKINEPLHNGYPGNTILHESISYGADKCIDFILTLDVDLELKNKDGNTPIHLAVLSENEYLTYRLIKLGAKLDKRNNLGDSVLHSAVRGGNLKIVNLIIYHNGNLLSKNKLGETALHTSLVGPKKDLKIIMSLVAGGSDLLTTNNNGHNLMKSFSVFRRTPKNEAIRTYIQQQVYLRHKEKYTEIIKEHPELSFIETVDSQTGKKVDLKKYKFDTLEIEMPTKDISNSSLYFDKRKYPTKIFEGDNNNIEGFTSNDNTGEGNQLEELEALERRLDLKSCDTMCVFKYSSIALLIILVLFLFLKLKK